MLAEGWHASKPLDIGALERESLERLRDEAPRVPPVPFGFANDAWTAFKQRVRPGDTVVLLTSPDGSWGRSAGWRGYALVRDGIVVARFTTMVS